MNEMRLYNGAPSPCKGCTKRWVKNGITCHGSCKEFMEFRAERESEYGDHKHKMELNMYVTESIRRHRAKRNFKR